MNFISEHNSQAYSTGTARNTAGRHDFGPKNLALIIGVAAILGILAWEQKPLHVASGQRAETKEAIKLAGNSSQVLGASTTNKALLEQFSNVQVTATTDNSQAAFVNYANQFYTAAQANFLSELTANAEASPEMIKKQNKFLEDIQKLAVPSELADYHRLTIAYYSLYFLYGQGLVTAESETLLEALQIELSTMREGYRISAGVSLP